MNLEEWRQQIGGEMELPSGLKIVYNQRFSVFDLAATGQIPQVLIGLLKGGQAKDGDAITESVTMDGATVLQNLAEFITSADTIIRATWISPAVADEPGDDCIGINEIPAADKIAFFTRVAEGSGITAVSKFRGQPPGNGDATPDGADVPDTAVSDPRSGG